MSTQGTQIPEPASETIKEHNDSKAEEADISVLVNKSFNEEKLKTETESKAHLVEGEIFSTLPSTAVVIPEVLQTSEEPDQVSVKPKPDEIVRDEYQNDESNVKLEKEADVEQDLGASAEKTSQENTSEIENVTIRASSNEDETKKDSETGLENKGDQSKDLGNENDSIQVTETVEKSLLVQKEGEAQPLEGISTIDENVSATEKVQDEYEDQRKSKILEEEGIAAQDVVQSIEPGHKKEITEVTKTVEKSLLAQKEGETQPLEGISTINENVLAIKKARDEDEEQKKSEILEDAGIAATDVVLSTAPVHEKEITKVTETVEKSLLVQKEGEEQPFKGVSTINENASAIEKVQDEDEGRQKSKILEDEGTAEHDVVQSTEPAHEKEITEVTETAEKSLSVQKAGETQPLEGISIINENVLALEKVQDEDEDQQKSEILEGIAAQDAVQSAEPAHEKEQTEPVEESLLVEKEGKTKPLEGISTITEKELDIKKVQDENEDRQKSEIFEDGGVAKQDVIQSTEPEHEKEITEVHTTSEKARKEDEEAKDELGNGEESVTTKSYLDNEAEKLEETSSQALGEVESTHESEHQENKSTAQAQILPEAEETETAHEKEILELSLPDVEINQEDQGIEDRDLHSIVEEGASKGSTGGGISQEQHSSTDHKSEAEHEKSEEVSAIETQKEDEVESAFESKTQDHKYIGQAQSPSTVEEAKPEQNLEGAVEMKTEKKTVKPASQSDENEKETVEIDTSSEQITKKDEVENKVTTSFVDEATAEGFVEDEPKHEQERSIEETYELKNDETEKITKDEEHHHSSTSEGIKEVEDDTKQEEAKPEETVNDPEAADQIGKIVKDHGDDEENIDLAAAKAKETAENLEEAGRIETENVQAEAISQSDETAQEKETLDIGIPKGNSHASESIDSTPREEQGNIRKEVTATLPSEQVYSLDHAPVKTAGEDTVEKIENDEQAITEGHSEVAVKNEEETVKEAPGEFESAKEPDKHEFESTVKTQCHEKVKEENDERAFSEKQNEVIVKNEEETSREAPEEFESTHVPEQHEFESTAQAHNLAKVEDTTEEENPEAGSEIRAEKLVEEQESLPLSEETGYGKEQVDIEIPSKEITEDDKVADKELHSYVEEETTKSPPEDSIRQEEEAVTEREFEVPKNDGTGTISKEDDEPADEIKLEDPKTANETEEIVKEDVYESPKDLLGSKEQEHEINEEGLKDVYKKDEATETEENADTKTTKITEQAPRGFETADEESIIKQSPGEERENSGDVQNEEVATELDNKEDLAPTQEPSLSEHEDLSEKTKEKGEDEKHYSTSSSVEAVIPEGHQNDDLIEEENKTGKGYDEATKESSEKEQISASLAEADENVVEPLKEISGATEPIAESTYQNEHAKSITTVTTAEAQVSESEHTKAGRSDSTVKIETKNETNYLGEGTITETNKKDEENKEPVTNTEERLEVTKIDKEGESEKDSEEFIPTVNNTVEEYNDQVKNAEKELTATKDGNETEKFRENPEEAHRQITEHLTEISGVKETSDEQTESIETVTPALDSEEAHSSDYTVKKGDEAEKDGEEVIITDSNPAVMKHKEEETYAEEKLEATEETKEIEKISENPERVDQQVIEALCKKTGATEPIDGSTQQKEQAENFETITPALESEEAHSSEYTVTTTRNEDLKEKVEQENEGEKDDLLGSLNEDQVTETRLKNKDLEEADQGITFRQPPETSTVTEPTDEIIQQNPHPESVETVISAIENQEVEQKGIQQQKETSSSPESTDKSVVQEDKAENIEKATHELEKDETPALDQGHMDTEKVLIQKVKNEDEIAKFFPPEDKVKREEDEIKSDKLFEATEDANETEKKSDNVEEFNQEASKEPKEISSETEETGGNIKKDYRESAELVSTVLDSEDTQSLDHSKTEPESSNEKVDEFLEQTAEKPAEHTARNLGSKETTDTDIFQKEYEGNTEKVVAVSDNNEAHPSDHAYTKTEIEVNSSATALPEDEVTRAGADDFHKVDDDDQGLSNPTTENSFPDATVKELVKEEIHGTLEDSENTQEQDKDHQSNNEGPLTETSEAAPVALEHLESKLVRIPHDLEEKETVTQQVSDIGDEAIGKAETTELIDSIDKTSEARPVAPEILESQPVSIPHDLDAKETVTQEVSDIGDEVIMKAETAKVRDSTDSSDEPLEAASVAPENLESQPVSIPHELIDSTDKTSEAALVASEKLESKTVSTPCDLEEKETITQQVSDRGDEVIGKAETTELIASTDKTSEAALVASEKLEDEPASIPHDLETKETVTQHVSDIGDEVVVKAETTKLRDSTESSDEPPEVAPVASENLESQPVRIPHDSDAKDTVTQQVSDIGDEVIVKTETTKLRDSTESSDETSEALPVASENPESKPESNPSDLETKETVIQQVSDLGNEVIAKPETTELIDSTHSSSETTEDRLVASENVESKPGSYPRDLEATETTVQEVPDIGDEVTTKPETTKLAYSTGETTEDKLVASENVESKPGSYPRDLEATETVIQKVSDVGDEVNVKAETAKLTDSTDETTEAMPVASGNLESKQESNPRASENLESKQESIPRDLEAPETVPQQVSETGDEAIVKAEDITTLSRNAQESFVANQLQDEYVILEADDTKQEIKVSDKPPEITQPEDIKEKEKIIETEEPQDKNSLSDLFQTSVTRAAAQTIQETPTPEKTEYVHGYETLPDEHKQPEEDQELTDYAGDEDSKGSHKKHPHNLLSGVGSKMKHSLDKVKKAITGKSSHSKPKSPN